MNTQLEAGMYLKAKNPCKMLAGGEALIVGKEYLVESTTPRSFIIKSEMPG